MGAQPTQPMSEREFNRFVSRCRRELEKKRSRLEADFGLGSWASWKLDGETGLLVFCDEAGRVGVEARVSVIGSFSPKGQSWKWAWSNASYPETVRQEALVLRELATITGMRVFDDEAFRCDEDLAWSVAASCVQQLGALGCYRATGQTAWVFLAIRDVRRVGARS
jgi:hypothetical protein